MKVLGIDIGAAGAYAHNDRRGAVYSGTRSFKGRRGARWLQFQDWLREIDSDVSPDLVVYERPCGPYGALRALYGFVTLIEQYAAQTDTRTLEVPPAKLKKYATGNGRASKDEMTAAARKRWPEIEIVSHDQADALWLMAYGQDGEEEKESAD